MMSHNWFQDLSNKVMEFIKNRGVIHAGHIININSSSTMFLFAISYFLATAMLVINGAFLLEKIAPSNRFQTFLAQQHRFQRAFGILLLILSIAPLPIAWYSVHLLSKL